MRARVAKKIAAELVLTPGTDLYDRVWNKIIRAGEKWWPPRIPRWVQRRVYGADGVSNVPCEDTDMLPSEPILTIQWVD